MKKDILTKEEFMEFAEKYEKFYNTIMEIEKNFVRNKTLMRNDTLLEKIKHPEEVCVHTPFPIILKDSIYIFYHTVDNYDEDMCEYYTNYIKIPKKFWFEPISDEDEKKNREKKFEYEKLKERRKELEIKRYFIDKTIQEYKDDMKFLKDFIKKYHLQKDEFVDKIEMIEKKLKEKKDELNKTMKELENVESKIKKIRDEFLF